MANKENLDQNSTLTSDEKRENDNIRYEDDNTKMIICMKPQKDDNKASLQSPNNTNVRTFTTVSTPDNTSRFEKNEKPVKGNLFHNKLFCMSHKMLHVSFCFLYEIVCCQLP